MLLLWSSAPFVFYLLFTVFGLLLGWVSWRIGFVLGFRILFSVLDIHLFVADVVISFDTVDRGVLDLVLSSLGLPGWFRHAYFEFHSHVRLRFKFAVGLGQPWTRDGGIVSALV